MAYDFVVDGIYYNKKTSYWDSSRKAYVSGTCVYVAPQFSNQSSNAAAYSEEVVIPASVEYGGVTYPVKGVDQYAFGYCSAVTKVVLPESVNSIGCYSFYCCSSLESISMPGVTSFNNYAFCNCSSLRSVTIAAGATSLPYGMFQDCSKLTEVNLPSTLTSVEGFAFSGCGTLTSIELPDNVSSIGSSCFCYCYALQTVKLSSKLSSIPGNAFQNCHALKTITLPDGMVSLGKSAFYNCISLESINFPEGMTTISESAFSGCSKLSKVDLPKSMAYVAANAFYDCNMLSEINVTYGSEKYSSLKGVLMSADQTKIAIVPKGITGEIDIPAGVTSVDANAFSGCSGISTINYGGTIADWCGIKFGNSTATPFGANANATLKIGGEAVESALVIPASVTEIGQYAFYNNKSITSVTIPSSVTKIGAKAFNVSGLEKIVVNGSTPATVATDAFVGTSLFFVGNSDVDTYKAAWTSLADRIFPQTSLETIANTSAADGKSALLNAIGGVGNEANIVSLKVNGTINGYDIMLMRNKLTNLRYLDLSDATIVPEKDNYQYYTGYYTKENVLGAYSFYDVDNLRSVVLPKNITSIETRAFSACDNLIEVTGMPECCTTIGSYAFAGGYINSMYQYPKLSKIEIGTGVTSIGYDAFYYCRNLKTISIPASVKTIGSEAFEYCYALETVNFAEGLETIESYAFAECSILNELRLPASLKKINSYAFRNCTSLEQIHIPSMLTSIGDNAFTGCTKAKDVYSYTLVPINILQNTFIYDGVTLHAPQVPESVFWDYYTNTQWSQFTNVVPFDAKYSSWYMGEDKDITIGSGETIPNEDGEQAEGTMQPGSGLVYEEGSYQWLDKLNLKWKDGKAPSLLDNGDMFVDELVFTLDVQANKWYFFCFPFDIDLDKAKFNGKFVWRYYDGDERAANGQGGWKNVVANEQGKKILRAYQGYIFQTNQTGEIDLTIIDPVFTAKDKQVTIAAHPAENAQDASWNLVGNPNISYYDLSNFLVNFDKPITVWDPVNNTYTAVMPGDDDYEFHPFEAFFVQKPNDVETITFDNEARETYSEMQKNSAMRAKSRATRTINMNRRLVNLTITDGEKMDKTRVVFNDEKTMEYDVECDASKFLSSDGVAQIYTLDNNGVKYAINERPNKDNTVRLGYVAPTDGTYSICIQRMDKAMALKDSQTGAVYSLSNGVYEFETKAGTYDNRFMLIPDVDIATGVNTLQNMGIVVETVNGGICLGGLNGMTAQVFTVNGAMVATIGENGHADVPAGTYIVTVGENSSKVVVR